MKAIQVDIDSITPYARNPRNNALAVDSVAASIKEFGFQQPIVVDKEKVIIVGHTRHLAARQLNLKSIPIVIADKLTDAQIKAYRIADNRVNQNATWDYELLKIEFEEIPDELLFVTGFDEGELKYINDGWDSNHDKMENIDPIDSVDLEKIVVKCTNEQKQEVYEAVSNAVQSLGYDDVEVT
tara:strand:- start:4715 stop:5263 length:549 start_codon:yes stop_codon:yes gene_type:complete